MMAGTSKAGAQKLSEAILAEAREQAQKILDQARERADSLIAQASSEANELLKKSRATAHAEAIRRTELINATIPVEAEQLRSQAVERLLAGIYQETRRQLLVRVDFASCETLISLAVGPLRQMSGNSFIVRIAPDDYARLSLGNARTDSKDNQLANESASFSVKSVSTSRADRLSTQEFVEAIVRQLGRSDVVLSLEPDNTVQAGVIVQDKPGRQVWDNRLTARLDRFWPELKRQVAAQIGLIGAANLPENGQ